MKTRGAARLALPLIALFAAACGGDNVARVTAPDGPADATLLATREGGIVLVRGGQQIGTPGQPLPDSVVVRAVNKAGTPVVGRTITFEPADGGAAEPRQVVTGADGTARTRWTLGRGTSLSAHTLRATSLGGTLGVMALHRLGRGRVVGVVKMSGDEQKGISGAPLSQSLAALLVRDNATLATSTPVTWEVISGGGKIVTAGMSNGAGVTTAQWEMGAGSEQTVRASVAGGASVVFHAFVLAPIAVTVQPSAITLSAGTSTRLRASGTDITGSIVTGFRPVWRSDDSTIARVDTSGLVVGVKAGTTTIRVTIGTITATATVIVTAPPANVGPRISGVQLEHSPYPFTPGSRISVYLSLSDDDGVMGGTVTARAPDGIQTLSCNLLPYGTQFGVAAPGPKFASWTCELVVAANSQPGIWTIDPITARDSRGNVTTLTGAQLIGGNSASAYQFPVKNLSFDREAPVITRVSLSLEPGPNGGRYLVTRVGTRGIEIAEGAGTGINVISPGFPLDRINTCSLEFFPSPDDYICRSYIAPGEAGGEVVIKTLGVSDEAYNSRSYNTLQLEALGYPARIKLP